MIQKNNERKRLDYVKKYYPIGTYFICFANEQINLNTLKKLTSTNYETSLKLILVGIILHFIIKLLSK